MNQADSRLLKRRNDIRHEMIWNADIRIANHKHIVFDVRLKLRQGRNLPVWTKLLIADHEFGIGWRMLSHQLPHKIANWVFWRTDSK